jgi:hypothetical protein
VASTRWHDWDRRIIGWFLTALLVLVMLLGDPSGDRSGQQGPEAAPDATPTRLCGSLEQMAGIRDQLVDGSPAASVAELREAAQRTRELGDRTADLDPGAQAGLHFFTGLFLALPDRPTTQQLLSAGAPASVTDQAHSDALVDWLQRHCAQP